VVAIVGADGAGKSTVARAVPGALGRPARYLYMGVNLEASNVVLPTTWLILQLKRLSGGRPDMAPATTGHRTGAASPGRRLLRAVREGMRVGNLIAEEWFRQLLVWRRTAAGEIIVCDRHFYADYHAHDIADRRTKPLARRIHGALLDRWYPRPDLVVCLEAPPEVLWERKREGTVASVAERQREYLALRAEVAAFEVVDATQPPERVLEDVLAAIRAHGER
jgi:thymidylate kinase